MRQSRATALSLVAFASLAVSTSVAVRAAQVTDVYDFPGGALGQYPNSTLVIDRSGALYGTTEAGGPIGGVVYKLTAGNSGQFNEAALADVDQFSGNVGVTTDPQGNVYGTTYAPNSGSSVFELSPNGSGQYEYATVYAGPYAGELGALSVDAAGDVYGTVADASTAPNGLIGLLVPGASGDTFNPIYAFTGSPNGASPVSPIAFAQSGTVFGATSGGGSAGYGTVYSLVPSSSGYSERVVHSFSAAQSGPVGVTLGPNGSIYGALSIGATGCGGVYRLKPARATYAESIVHTFAKLATGCGPVTPPAVDASGNVFQAVPTYVKASRFWASTLYEFSPGRGKKYTSHVLAQFPPTDFNNSLNSYSPIVASPGVLFGVVHSGGTHSVGFVYRVTY